MKPILAILFSVFFLQNGISQTVSTFKSYEKEFIKPSINQMINLLEMDFAEWEAAMQRLDYEKISEPNKSTIYSKGKIGSITQAISKTNRLVSIDWWDFEHHEVTLKSAKQELKGHYAYSSNEIDFYHYKDYVIGITYVSDEDFIMERILIKNK